MDCRSGSSPDRTANLWTAQHSASATLFECSMASGAHVGWRRKQRARKTVLCRGSVCPLPAYAPDRRADRVSNRDTTLTVQALQRRYPFRSINQKLGSAAAIHPDAVAIETPAPVESAFR